jgi:hypothetical protein
MSQSLFQRIRRTHWAVLVFVGAVLLQLICSGLALSSSFWGHTLLVYAAVILLLTPVIALLALIIEFFKKATGEPAQLRLVGATFIWSLLVSAAFLILLGPVVGIFIENEFIGGTHFNGRVYYISSKREGDAVHVFDLYECNYIGLSCRRLDQIAKGESREFTLDVVDKQLEIKYDNQVVYTLGR